MSAPHDVILNLKLNLLHIVVFVRYDDSTVRFKLEGFVFSPRRIRKVKECLQMRICG